MSNGENDVPAEDTHDWVRDETEPAVQRCQNQGCTVRRAHPGTVWQRKKGGHWRSIRREAVPACTAK